MYFHSILTALAFIFTFASIEFIFATVAWKGFGENIWHKLSKFLLDNERSVDGGTIEDDESSQSDQKSEYIIAEQEEEEEDASVSGGSLSVKSD